MIKLQVQQTQKIHLKMTTELRQAIELLQYTNDELYQYIKEQALENPLIELIESDKHLLSVNSGQNHSLQHDFSIDSLQSRSKDMRSRLIQEVKLQYCDLNIQSLLTYLIDHLDDDGYLQINGQVESKYNNYEIEKGIHLLQNIGPTGIGARNLKECLLLQIAYDHPKQKLAYYLVQEHLELLAYKDFEHITSLLTISLNEIIQIEQFIKTLNPKPCASLSDFEPQYLQPDIIIENSNTDVSFYLNDRYMPKIILNQDYDYIKQNDEELSGYLKEKYNHYRWLQQSIKQRRSTLIKIVSAVIRRQEPFFKYGFMSLEPMTLKDVANDIGMHESTVSRATKNKYIQSPHGVFAFKSLFTSKIETTDGNSMSSIKVKTLIKDIIELENEIKPWSDQKIAQYLKQKYGIKISRRTISKYREELHIPSSRFRKIVKQ